MVYHVISKLFPFVALVVYTFGIIFLVISPAEDVLLSPGISTEFDLSFLSVLSLFISGALFLIVLMYHKWGMTAEQ